jgi:hypothetical protein
MRKFFDPIIVVCLSLGIYVNFSSYFVKKYTARKYESSDNLTLVEVNYGVHERFTFWPIVIKKWNKNDNLRTMKRVLGRMGYEKVDGMKEKW